MYTFLLVEVFLQFLVKFSKEHSLETFTNIFAEEFLKLIIKNTEHFRWTKFLGFSGDLQILRATLKEFIEEMGKTVPFACFAYDETGDRVIMNR